MTHKEQVSDQQKQTQLSFLRKQRDGVIIGEYRSMLAGTYNEIRTLCCKNRGVCCLSELQNQVENDDLHKKNILLDNCLDLEQLGYIRVHDNDSIEITHEMDF